MKPEVARGPPRPQRIGAVLRTLRLSLCHLIGTLGGSVADRGVRSSRLALVVLLAAGISACTRTIDDGKYGPLQIGEGKAATLARLERHGIRIDQIEPKVPREVRVERPTLSTIHALDGETGIIVWLDGHPAPLRIELDEDVVRKTWPEMMGRKRYSAAHGRVTEALGAIQLRLPAGTHRAQVYDAILDLADRFEVTLGNYVAGEDRFYLDPGLRQTSEYRDFVLGADVWEFSGLKEQVWYPTWYSEVTLTFEGTRLKSIEHWASPFELL